MESPPVLPSTGREPLSDLRDQRGSEILSGAECLALLRQAAGGFGRLGINIGGTPSVMPLNFVMLTEHIVLRVGPGSILEAAAEEPTVAFEIDRLDHKNPDDPQAWSVLVKGTIEVMRDPIVLEEAMSTGLTPLVDEPGEVYLTVRTEFVSGRRFRIGALARFGLGPR
ncbi:MAG: pyridoxamine 5'-phosphate oxidase family protein [Acidimicrobiales bacterium]|jgi:nitroimidazol reductase NimA-like FMN-containing flavoprotein (pyridoxamine 5'-phosphate oxidase superfamily)